MLWHAFRLATAMTPAPAPPRPLWHDALWSLLGEGFYAGGLFGTLVILARLGSVEVLGQYTLGLAIATPAILLTNLHLRPAFVVDDDGWRYDEYVTLRLLTIPLALLVTAAAAFLGGYDMRTVLMIVAVGGLRGWESLSDILLAPAQKAERMAAVGRSRALRGILTALGLGVGLALTDDALVGMALSLLLLAGLSLLHDIRVAQRFATPRPRRPTRALLALARHTLPIGLAATLLSASTNIPAYALEQHYDVAALGYFGAAMSIMYVGNVLNVALGNAAIPRLARRYRQGKGQLGGLLARLVAVVVGLNGVMIVGTLLLGAMYLRVVYGEPYVAYVTELELAAATAAVAGLANMLSQTLTAMGRFGQQLAINVVGVVGSVAATLWLVPGGGVRGAMLALLAISGLRLVIYAGAMLGAIRAPTPAIED